MGIISAIKGVFGKLFNRSDIAQKLGVKIETNSLMSDAVSQWSALYADKAEWVGGDVKSWNLAQSAAHEFARMATLEFKSELTGSPRAEFLSDVYKSICSDAMEWVEFAAALGGVMLKPYVNGGRLYVDYVRADSFIPCEFNSTGDITACIFTEQFMKDGKYYTRLEYHRSEGMSYTVTNRAYVSNQQTQLGRQVRLDEIPQWADLEETTELVNITRPLYSYMKMPGGNHIDRYSPLGCSIYAPAVGLIEQIDKQYSRLIWEYEGSELAIVADVTMFSDAAGNQLPKLNKRLFKGISSGQEDFYEPFSPAIRDVNLVNGLNTLLRRFEFLCGFAYGTFSDMNMTEKTATELKMSKQRSYSTVSKAQEYIKNTMTDLIEVLNIYCDLYGLCPAGAVEASFDFDDSLITDIESERRIWMEEVAAGLMRPEVYLMKVYGYTEKQALDMLPSQMPLGDEFDGLE